MRKKILAAVGAPILLASTLLAGSAAAKPSHKVVKPAKPILVCSSNCLSDHIVFYGTVVFLPTADNPKLFVIVQDKPTANTPLPCSLASDGEQTVVGCTGTSHGTISQVNGVPVFTGSTTVASSDGVIQFAGSQPVGGNIKLTSCKEIDTDGTTTTGCTIGGRASLYQVGTTWHVYADYTVNETPGPNDID
jgi:hypothetical protein